MGDKVIDLAHQVLDIGKRAATDRFVGHEPEKAFDLIEPTGVGRREMKMPARPGGQPGFHLCMLVRRVVVADEMNVQIRRHRRFDGAQEGQEFLMAVARFALRDD